MTFERLYLSSQSPRRAELLEQIGIDFDRLNVDVDETPEQDELPADYVMRLAIDKAVAGSHQVTERNLPKLPVLGSDTSVVFDGQIMGKPRDHHHGVEMLSILSGNIHQVMSAVCIAYNNKQHTAINITDVHFRHIDRDEIEAYWLTGEPADKAGGYGIQGKGAIFIDNIRGSYSSVVGLPLTETWYLLKNIEQA